MKKLATTIYFLISCSLFGITNDVIILNHYGKGFKYDAKNALFTNVLNSIPNGQEIVDSYYDEETKQIFITSSDSKMYELNLNTSNLVYKRIGPIDELINTAWFDSVNKRPAWLWQNTVVYLKTNNKVAKSDKGNIFFTGGWAFGLNIDKTLSLADIQKRINNDIKNNTISNASMWIINGRSKYIEAYGQIIASQISPGSRFKKSLLIFNKNKNNFTYKDFDNFGYVSIYSDVLCVQEIIDVKNDKEPLNKNEIQPEITGKWFFYLTSNNKVFEVQLNKDAIVYARGNQAWAISENKFTEINFFENDFKMDTIPVAILEEEIRKIFIF